MMAATFLPRSRLLRQGFTASTPHKSCATSSGGLTDAFGKQHVARGVNRLVDGVIKRGEGSFVEMRDGRRFLDFTSGIGVTNRHCHPNVSKAAADQCMNIVHGQCSIAFHEPYLALIDHLLPIMPDKSLDSFFFWNSGSEAVEASIKLARSVTGRQNIIVMQGAYHGRTFGAMALTRSKTVYSDRVAPLMPGVFVTGFPYWHQLGLGPDASEEEVVRRSLHSLDVLLAQQTSGKDTAAVLVEPVLGEGGYVPAPPAFLHGLREVCDKHGMLLICDEVQCGFGRTGKYFFSEYSGVRPDIMVMAKGLANGFPLSGIVSRKEITDKQMPGTMGGTYAGNAVSCAAASAVIEAMEREKTLENVQARSKELFTALHSLKTDPASKDTILDIRGEGLMVAVEFASPTASPHDPILRCDAPKTLAARVSKRCLEKGMFLLTTSIFEIVRFIPPLNISSADLQKGTEIFSNAVKEVVREG